MPVIKYSEAVEYSKNTSIVIGLAKGKNTTEFANQFSLLDSLYNDSVLFVLVDKKEVRLQIGSQMPPEPVLFTIVNGSLVDFTGNIETHEMFAFAVENLINPREIFIHKNQDLAKNFGMSHLTFFTSGYFSM